MKIELIIDTQNGNSNAVAIYNVLVDCVEAYRRRIRTLDDPNQQFETNWNDTCSVRVTE